MQHQKPSLEKIQKLLANYGLGSRREIERWIAAGRVSVNGKVSTIGDRATIKDRIRVDGRLIKLEKHSPSDVRLLLYHKPAGEICTRSDPNGRPTVFAKLPPLRQGRWVMVGRLDINTSGLLLFCNNGEIANRLMHPSYQLEREYAVRILGKVDDTMLQRLSTDVMLDDGKAHFTHIKFAGGEGANRWYHVTTSSGRNRIVRRLWESQGVTVSRLIRIRFGTLTLPSYLKQGSFQMLDNMQLQRVLTKIMPDFPTALD